MLPKLDYNPRIRGCVQPWYSGKELTRNLSIPMVKMAEPSLNG